MKRKSESLNPPLAYVCDLGKIITSISSTGSADDIIFYLGLLKLDTVSDSTIEFFLVNVCKQRHRYTINETVASNSFAPNDMIKIFSKLKSLGFNPSGDNIADCLPDDAEWSYAEPAFTILAKLFLKVWPNAAFDADPIYRRYLRGS